MSFAFEKPENQREWVTATQSAALWALDALTVVDPVSAARTTVSSISVVRAFSNALKGTESSTPENRAWKWLSLTIAEAVAQFLVILRKETELQGNKKDVAVRTFLEKSLDIGSDVYFDEAALASPATHAAFKQARSQVPQLVADVTLLTNFDSERWKLSFDDCLASASVKMVAACHDELKSLLDAISGSAGEALRRDLAWARHNRWLAKRFCEDPVFSPDGSLKTPLQDLYLRLRCYWHVDVTKPSKHQQEAFNKTYRAYLEDLHETLEGWLEASDQERLRVVAGGPGSGKSSFAKAFAQETSAQGKRRVIFVELQHMHLTGSLYADIGKYMHERNQPQGDAGSPGFGENPLDWIKEDNRPALLIFDGLDEITHDGQAATELSRNFILNAHRLLEALNSGSTQVKAIILGRNAACQEGLEAGALPLQTMLNVAPIRMLLEEDLNVHSSNLLEMHNLQVPSMSDHIKRDQRPEYWNLWQAANGEPFREPPEAVTHEGLSDLNVEPLLLHLLILSDYCGERWEEAAENRNVVYFDILQKIHQRNVDERKAGMHLEEDAYFLLMECLGLAAWHGNLRTGTEASYIALRNHHARKLKSRGDFKHADLKSIPLWTMGVCLSADGYASHVPA